MKRIIGTKSMGLRAPIIEEGDDLEEIVVDTVKCAVENHGISIKDKDVICVTESLVARAQGNYATTEQIAKDINNKFSSDELVVLFPILSRNRFSILLKAIAESGKNYTFAYPTHKMK